MISIMKKNIFYDILNRVPKEERRYYRLSRDIASYIYNILRTYNISQKEFAQKIGKSESEISKWLSGNHNFTLKTIAKIESILNYDLIKIPFFEYINDSMNYSQFVQIKGSDLKSRLSNQNNLNLYKFNEDLKKIIDSTYGYDNDISGELFFNSCQVDQINSTEFVNDITYKNE